MSFRRFDPPALYRALEAERERRGVTWDRVAEEAGVPSGVIMRLRAYRRFVVHEVLPLTQWLGLPLANFTRLGPPPEQMR
jgi:hypothetical protein